MAEQKRRAFQQILKEPIARNRFAWSNESFPNVKRSGLYVRREREAPLVCTLRIKEVKASPKMLFTALSLASTLSHLISLLCFSFFLVLYRERDTGRFTSKWKTFDDSGGGYIDFPWPTCYGEIA